MASSHLAQWADSQKSPFSSTSPIGLVGGSQPALYSSKAENGPLEDQQQQQEKYLRENSCGWRNLGTNSSSLLLAALGHRKAREIPPLSLTILTLPFSTEQQLSGRRDGHWTGCQSAFDRFCLSRPLLAPLAGFLAEGHGQYIDGLQRSPGSDRFLPNAIQQHFGGSNFVWFMLAGDDGLDWICLRLAIVEMKGCDLLLEGVPGRLKFWLQPKGFGHVKGRKGKG